MFRLLMLAAVLMSASGCAKFNRLRTDISAPVPSTNWEEASLINNLRQAYTGCDDQTAIAQCTTRTFDTKVKDTSEFLQAGMTLSDLFCDRFFRNTNRSARDRRFSRAAVNDVGGAINVVLGLAKAGSGVSNGIGAGFALGDSLFRNYDESYMVDADLSKVQRLVHAAQDNMKVRLEKDKPKNVFAAETAILRYANLCSFLGMQSLLNDSVAAKTDDIEKESKDIAGAGVGIVPVAGTRNPVVVGTTAGKPAADLVAPLAAPANESPPPPPAGSEIGSPTP